MPKMKISWSIEETRASQPKIRSNPVNEHSEQFLPIGEKKWKDVLAYEVQRTYFGIQHLEVGYEVGAPPGPHKKEKLIVLFTGNRWVQNCGTHVGEKVSTPSLTPIGFSMSTDGATKPGSNVATLTTFYCIFALFKETLE